MTFSSDIVVEFTPVKARPGVKPMVRRVFVRFGTAQTRLVQEICDAVSGGGDCVYFEVDGVTTVIPVFAWKRADWSAGQLTYIAKLLCNMHGNGGVVVYGVDRTRWRLGFHNESRSSARDALDAEPDSAGEPVQPNGTGASDGLRERF